MAEMKYTRDAWLEARKLVVRANRLEELIALDAPLDVVDSEMKLVHKATAYIITNLEITAHRELEKEAQKYNATHEIQRDQTASEEPSNNQ